MLCKVTLKSKFWGHGRGYDFQQSVKGFIHDTKIEVPCGAACCVGLTCENQNQQSDEAD